MSVDTLRIIVDAEDRASGVLGKVGGALGGFGKVGLAAVAGVGALVSGGFALTKVLTDCVGEAIGAQEATAQLDAVLKSTGGAAGVTAEMANDLAASLSGVTRFGDEAIMSGESMLLTFTNIGKDVFPATTEVMLDMSQALGQDLKSSAMQLGKALNDPVAGVSALQRVGVTFTDSQKAVIEQMVATGDTAGAQKLILAELQKEFGGSAVAAGQTFAGQLDILNNALGNVKEGVGMALMPALTGLATTLGPVLLTAAQGFADFLTTTVVPAVSTAMEIVGNLANYVSQLPARISGLIGIWDMWRDRTDSVTEAVSGFLGTLGIAFPVLQRVTTPLKTFFETLVDLGGPGSDVGLVVEGVAYAFEKMHPALRPVTQALQEFGLWLQFAQVWAERFVSSVAVKLPEIQAVALGVFSQVRTIIEGHSTEVQVLLQDAWSAVTALAGSTWTQLVSTVQTAFSQVTQFCAEHATEIQTGLQIAWDFIGAFIQNKITFITSIVQAGLALLRGDWDAAFGFIGDAVNARFGGITDTLSGSMFSVRDAVAQTLGALKGIVSSVLDIIVGVVQDHGAAILTQFRAAWQKLQEIVADALAVVMSVVGSVLGNLQTFLAAHGDEIRTTLGHAWEQIGRIINLALELIQATVVPILQGIGSFIRNHSTEIQTLLDGAWTFIKTVIQTVLGVIEGIIKTVLAAVKGDWKGAWEEVKKVADTLWSGINKIIEAALNTLLSLVGTNLEKIKQWFVDKFNEIKAFISSIDLAEMGRNLIQGLINGIASKFEDAIAEAKRIIGGIKNAILGGLEEHSPSQFGVRAGAWLGQGLALGIEESQPMSLGALGTHIAAIVTELERLANSVISPAAIASAKAVTDPIKAILENVAGIVAGVDALAAVRTPLRIDEQLQAVSDAVSAIVYHYQYMANQVVSAPAVWSAKAFSDPLAEIFDNLQSIVAGTVALGDLAGAATDLPERIGVLGTVVDLVAHALSAVAAGLPDLGAAAAVLAQNMAPVLDLVEPAVRAFDELLTSGWGLVEQEGQSRWLVAQIRGLGSFVRELAGALGGVAVELGTDLLEAARALGEAIGPVLDLVETAIGAFYGLLTNGFMLDRSDGLVRLLDSYKLVGGYIRGLGTFLHDLARALGGVAVELGTDLLEAARALGENLAPVLSIVSPALSAMQRLGQELTLMRPVQLNVNALADFMRLVVDSLGRASELVAGELQTAARELAANVEPTFRVLTSAIDMIAKLGRVDLEMLPSANNALDHVAAFVGRIVVRIGELRRDVGDELLADAQWLAETGTAVFQLLSEAIANLGAVAALDATSLYEWAFDAGWSWVTGLHDGIASGMTALQGVLGQVSGALAGALSPAAAPVGLGSNSAATKTAINNTFNIYNPVIRDEQDIAALADAVSERLGTRAHVYARMGAG